MYKLREGPRFDYREQQGRRVKEAPSLADKFPQLKSLILNLSHYGSKGQSKNSQIKYTPNLDNAKAVFRIDCPNQGCIGGDFELTKDLAKAVAAHRTKFSSELTCQGWQSKTTINTVRCHNILRYTLNLAY